MRDFDVFISHASEDKDACARPLAVALAATGLRVWFDEDVILLGDSIPKAIDAGLSRSRWGVVILSHSFFAKDWPQRELDALASRETQGGRKAILPVWHGVEVSDVARFSPTLSSRAAVSSAIGVPAIVSAIRLAIDAAERDSLQVPPLKDHRSLVRRGEDGTYSYAVTVKGFGDNVSNFMKYANANFTPLNSWAMSKEVETGWSQATFHYRGPWGPDRMETAGIGFGTSVETRVAE